jgi:TPR repeat protein
MQWYRLGAAKNHAHALNNMGMLYHNGQGVVKSYLDALEHWIRSAKKNNVLSMLNIGNLFNNGQGVPLDTIKAQQWYHINDVGIDKGTQAIFCC